MTSLADFLDGLLTKGTAVLRGMPPSTEQDFAPAIALLRAAHTDCRLEVAGPPIAFDALAALAAAQFVCRSCWFLLHRGQADTVVDKALDIPLPPTSAAQHLSADLTLRFLAPIYRRAREADPADVLTGRVAQVLRQAPLSGVLADLDAEPLAPMNLDNHSGLLLLYAERLAERVRPGWVPTGGLARQYVELVFAERNLTLPAPLETTSLKGDS
jgi:hypothetical protein